MTSSAVHDPPNGAQRLPLDRLRRWEAMSFGMFIHFGMSTFDGDEISAGDKPSQLYAPDELDVDQWISVARDAGMKYAVLTAKHVSGHCLWPSAHTDYHVGTSGNKTDVVAAFVKACEKRGLMAGLYYCSWDNHHRFGSVTPSRTRSIDDASTTSEYRQFQSAQVAELLQHYGPIGEVWIDIPGVLGVEGRKQQYEQIVSLSPNALVMMNQGFGDGSKLKYDYAWPTDLAAIERWLPASNRGYEPWHRLAIPPDSAPKDYYIPGEVCDPIGYEWFYVEEDVPRRDSELLGMRLICKARRANLLLDVPPDKHGLIPQRSVDALMRLAKNMEQLPEPASPTEPR
jgi:alpha-L-fucosidase